MERTQLPFATAAALTATAKDVQSAETREIKDVFDKPTPWTINSVYMKAARKDRLQSEVGLKFDAGKGNAPEKYLRAQMKGGERRLKRFERALYLAGVLPADHFVVPGEGCPMDAYGNIKAAFIQQLLSYFKAFPEQGYKANMTDRRREALAKGSRQKPGVVYFVASRGHLHPGVWARYPFSKGSALKPVLLFVKWTNYEAAFDFNYVAKTEIDRVWKRNFEASWKHALATARAR